MILYGALLNADIYLKDDARLQMWNARFERAELETKNKIQLFDAGRTHTQQMENAYVS